MKLSTTTNFLFEIKELPELSKWITSVNIPAISLSEIPVPSNRGTLFVPGSKIEYQKLNFTFLVDENFLNYKEIVKWLFNMRDPNIKSRSSDIFSDGTLTLLSNNKNPLLRFDFIDMFPIDISELMFTTSETDNLECTVMMSYTYFKIS